MPTIISSIWWRPIIRLSREAVARLYQERIFGTSRHDYSQYQRRRFLPVKLCGASFGGGRQAATHRCAQIDMSRRRVPSIRAFQIWPSDDRPTWRRRFPMAKSRCLVGASQRNCGRPRPILQSASSTGAGALAKISQRTDGLVLGDYRGHKYVGHDAAAGYVSRGCAGPDLKLAWCADEQSPSGFLQVSLIEFWFVSRSAATDWSKAVHDLAAQQRTEAAKP